MVAPVGQPDRLKQFLEPLALPAQLPRNVHFNFFAMARGRLRLAQRQPDQALAEFQAVGETCRALDVHNPAYSAWRSSAAAALLMLGRYPEACALAEEELSLARGWGAPPSIALALRTLGLAQQASGCASEGAGRLREAVDVFAASDARLEHAKSLVELGASLRRANRRSEARDLLRHGVEVAHHCGATALAERGNEELAATCARARKVLVTGPASLTASERRVAQLAAEDLSNKEIAQALFVTVKTVEVHLSNVYRKLDVASRRHLAIALAEPAGVAPAVA